MEDDGQTYIVPHPAFARIMMTAGGLFALIVPPYELWRGVWPLNITTPFFGFIMFGGMSVGAMFLWAGLLTPSGRMVFRAGQLEIHRSFLFGSSTSIVRAVDVSSIDAIEDVNSDGPNDWRAAIKIAGAQPVYSRPLGTRDAAQKLADTFRTKLGLPASPAPETHHRG